MAFAGENFGNITSFEVDATLENKKRTDRLTGMYDLIKADTASNNPTITSSHIYELLKTGNSSNPLINHLVEDIKSSKTENLEDFVNLIKNDAISDAATKKGIMQWGGDKWCEEILGPTAEGLSKNQQALQVCVNAIEAQFDMPAWEFLLNAKNREQLQN